VEVKTRITDDEIGFLVDAILDSDDWSGDGYINYSEFRKASMGGSMAGAYVSG